MNEKLLFNDGWEFAKSGLGQEDWAELSFEPVDLPHDWLIYDTLNLYENGIGWYRKRFSYHSTAERALLMFDGVYMDSSLYVNGNFVGEWKYGYSSFEHEITDALRPGENEIVVKVVHQSPNSRWYSGAGIYRNVWLKTRGCNHLGTDGVYASVKRENGDWAVEIETELNAQEDVVLSQTVLQDDSIIASVSTRIAGGCLAENPVCQKLEVRNPLLWSPEEPSLYRLVTRLRLASSEGGEGILETVSRNIGFREIELDPERGLILNGVRLKINGVCEHHDLGALGAAFSKEALRRRLSILKEMGANGIRTAHNMPAPELMDLADEMGFLIVSEAFDMWERPKTPYDYARFFKEWAAADVRSWVRRDRNHPSLLLWSIGNEIYDTHADERGQEITRMLAEEVRKHDPKGNARVTIGSNYMPWENARRCADIVKIAGYNYAEKYYRQHREEHPDWVIYGSETASVVQSRGVYRFPFEKPILTDDDEQCSALGNSPTSWGAKSAEACIIAERDTPFSLGQFLWTGFDYIGEPTPYHTKNSYFGQIDTATFKKDSYYIYQAAWTDCRTRPMVHLFPYWDFNPGQMIDVRVCTNAPKVELFVNGRSMGVQELDHKRGTQLVGWWKVPYEEGFIQAIAYDENGAVIATDARKSFGDAASIRLRTDKDRLTANGTDLIFVEIGMEDKDGHPVENANNRVRVEVTGEARLVGLDNGDSTDYDPYKGMSRRLFGGKLMAVVAATLTPGKARIEVSSAGMRKAALEFETVRADDPGALKGIAASARNRELPVATGTSKEIPLRKMEIASPSGQKLHASLREVTATVALFPADCSYREVEWSVVGESGIVSNIAKVEADGLDAKVTALGDGEFRLRCTSRNGTAKTKLISQLEFRVSGIGTAYKDPYGFISAGLYDYSKGEVGSGNERGVATSRDGETQVGFRNIDFGPYGSDAITIPIFALSSEEYPLQIWEGMPDEEGSVLLADVVYRKPSRWNVYQEETYRLSKRLRGLSSICFVLRQKVHIKGFSFARPNRALERLHAADGDRIYGDAYAIEETRVVGIGNNVSLEFDRLDFGSEGVTRLAVYGRSEIDRNTIRIRFESVEGKKAGASAGENAAAGQGADELVQIIEFASTDGYEERVFDLERVAGLRKVTFLFLPGSRFDFGWFRFIR
ncbi:DUF4982 domain-containing protein [Cohnella thailandensis]|uniref:DUF4982 domain-containing protein n=1 Tax=Cohnella thailandensis TaxID=557557 RepID=A0A841T277_9BACL|nr:DUF4982 domain-containing protein [Cohnella thailandensis]MBB6638254.1 DUF4982 domain-containing protein [Cohnella thailandensis]MBP1977815.1 beta-galactosidase [Cohnella thailandensis]